MGLIVTHFCCILDIPTSGIVVSERIFSYYKAIADPRGMVGRIYKGNTIHCYTQNIKVLDFVILERKIFMAFLLLVYGG